MKNMSKTLHIVKVKDRVTKEVVFEKKCNNISEAKALKNTKTMENEGLRYEVILEVTEEESYEVELEDRGE